jgi:hypothetical protein
MPSEAERKPPQAPSPLQSLERACKCTTYHSALPSRAEDEFELFAAAAEAKVDGPMMKNGGLAERGDCGWPAGRGSNTGRV